MQRNWQGIWLVARREFQDQFRDWRIVIPMMLPGVVGMWMSRGPWGAMTLFFILVLLTTFSLLVVNLAYLTIIKLFSPQRFKAVISLQP